MTSLVLIGVLVLAIVALIIAIVIAIDAQDEANHAWDLAFRWEQHAMLAEDQRDAAVNIARDVLLSPSKVGLGPGHKVGEC